MSEADSARQASLDQLLMEIRVELRQTRFYTGVDHLSAEVEAALRAVPRDAFVPEQERAAAYANIPLPIGKSQTISQPFIVALMTELLAVKPRDRVLEIGTGSGYQAAVLSTLAGRVYSLERIASLAQDAAARLARMGYRNVTVRQGDGYQGWPEQGPFDAIMVTAAAPMIPQALVEQLKAGGRLLIPVGAQWGPQQLMLVTKSARGEVEMRKVLDVAFVPLVEGADGID